MFADKDFEEGDEYGPDFVFAQQSYYPSELSFQYSYPEEFTFEYAD